MMTLPPHVRLLLAMQASGQTVDYAERAGILLPVTIRHARNRLPVRSEKPALSLILVEDDLREGEEQDRNAWETVRRMIVDVQADLDLDPEDSNLDPTGLAKMSLFIAAFVASLKDPHQPVFLGGKCDWITAGAIDPDDRSTPDIGRMTRALTVLYRVRSDDPNVLLAAGEDG